MSVESPTRLFWPDFVRTAAVLSVIVVHVSAVPVTHYRDIPLSWWWWANAYDSLVRPSIPLFVMLSGALLLPRLDWNPRAFFHRRVRRVAVPFIAWSVIYAGWNYVLHGVSTPPLQILRHLAGGMANPVYTHLWYLPLILSLYLLLPLIRLYTNNASFKGHLYFGGLWLFATAVKPWLEARWGFPIAFYLDPVVGFIGYFVLGSTFSMYLPARLSRTWLVIAIVGFIAGYAATVLGTYWGTASANGQLDETYYALLSPNVILMSVAAFALLRHVGARMQESETRSRHAIRFVTFASGVSFGAYLVHMIVIETLSSGMLGFSFGPMIGHPAYVVPALAAVTFLVSLALAALIGRSRYLRWLVP